MSTAKESIMRKLNDFFGKYTGHGISSGIFVNSEAVKCKMCGAEHEIVFCIKIMWDSIETGHHEAVVCKDCAEKIKRLFVEEE